MSWSVLISHVGRELAATEDLLASGIQAYCPIIRRLTKPKRKSKPVQIIQAAFPGYLFAESPLLCFSQIYIRPLLMGDKFCLVDDDEIQRLMDGDDERSIISDNEVKFYNGDHVKVLTGPLVDRYGVILSVRGQRCKLSMVGSTTNVYMPCFSLKKLLANTTLQ